jgi:hypothetical protein
MNRLSSARLGSALGIRFGDCTRVQSGQHGHGGNIANNAAIK